MTNQNEHKWTTDELLEYMEHNGGRLPLSYWEQTDTLIGAELRLRKAVIELWEVAAGQYLKRLAEWLRRLIS